MFQAATRVLQLPGCTRHAPSQASSMVRPPGTYHLGHHHCIDATSFMCIGLKVMSFLRVTLTLTLTATIVAVTGHGISEQLLSNVFQQFRAAFALPPGAHTCPKDPVRQAVCDSSSSNRSNRTSSCCGVNQGAVEQGSRRHAWDTGLHDNMHKCLVHTIAWRLDQQQTSQRDQQHSFPKLFFLLFAQQVACCCRPFVSTPTP